MLDLRAYTGDDAYSDGDIENEMLAAARGGKCEEMLERDNRWPVLYHFSDMRENLVSWMPIENKTVLEIGCGCGAVTGILASRASEVDAVEISPRRAEIAAWRHKKADNLTIHVGNLNDMRISKKFDIVTLIGVLEYAGTFTHTGNPFEDFLKTVKKYLKPDGLLIIAIENRLGMKYFAGAAEDHTGEQFDGILGYPEDGRIRTFSRGELKGLIDNAGYDAVRWYYPYPDYKLPIDISSDEMLPIGSQLMRCANYAYDRDRANLFPEQRALSTMLDNGLYCEFANSFLLICRNGRSGYLDDERWPIAVHSTEWRKKEYHILTAFFKKDGKKYIKKFAPHEEGEKYLRATAKNCEILSGRYGKKHVAQSRMNGNELLMEYVDGVSYTQVLLNAIATGGYEALSERLNFYLKEILENYGGDTVITLPFDWMKDNRQYDIDLVFDNIVMRDGEFVIIDYEMMLDVTAKRWMLWRAIRHLCLAHEEFLARHGLSMNGMLASCGITREMGDTFFKIEQQINVSLMAQWEPKYRKKTAK